MTDVIIPGTGDALAAPPARARHWPGRVALALGVATPIAVVVGIAAVAGGSFAVATASAWVAIGTSLIATLGGLVAAIGGWDRGAALGGIALGVLANPLVLLYGLDWVENLA